MNKEIFLTNSQTILLEDKESKAVAYVSGFGGGKTFVLVNKMVDIKMEHPNVDLLYLLPTFSMFRDILFPTISEVLDGTGIGYRINKSTGEIFFDCGGRVILKSMDAPDTIVGMNVFAVLLDELDTLPTQKARAVWHKAIARARKKIIALDENGDVIFDEDGDEQALTNQMIVGTTPEGFRFVYEMFVKNKPDNYRLIQASGYENVNLPKDYYESLKLVYPKELIEAYIDGEFVNMQSGSVYKSFDRELCDSDAIYRKGETLHISMDFNVMNMNAVVFVERDPLITGDKNFIYEGHNSFHAVRHLKGIKDTPEMIEVIQNRYPTSPIYVYPDASGKNASSKGFTTSDVSMLKKAGFHARHPNKNPRVMDRVQSLNMCFRTGLIRVNVGKCKELTEALEQQVYNPDTELPEKSASTSIDDINDSCGYFGHYKFPISRKTIKTKKLRGF